MQWGSRLLNPTLMLRLPYELQRYQLRQLQKFMHYTFDLFTVGTGGGFCVET
jgi:hypothetical protein